MTELALKIDIPGIIDEYNEKIASLSEEISRFENAVQQIKLKTCISGCYVGNVFWDRRDPDVSQKQAEAILLKSAWRHVYKLLNIETIASAKDRNLFEQSMEKPPEFTMDNLKASFGPYLQDSRYHILKGLAEAFCALDNAFKSHSRVKVGKKGQAKRIIIKNVVSNYSYFLHGHRAEEFIDMLNAFNVFNGLPHVTPEDRNHLNSVIKVGEGEYNGLRLVFWPICGNVHIFFTKDQMAQINRALAEFYGDVLPDVEDETPTKSQSTAVSKDLQYYPTPLDVSARAVERARLCGDEKVLEPSCGDGALLDAMAAEHPDIDLFGIEYHAGRAQQARQKGHAVLTGNFLEQVPTGNYDRVIMNPPFYGRHYVKHVLHAIKFLKPGGRLVCILPATARYDHKELPFISERESWRDLPIGSFRESGTNINTGLYVYQKPTNQ